MNDFEWALEQIERLNVEMANLTLRVERLEQAIALINDSRYYQHFNNYQNGNWS